MGSVEPGACRWVDLKVCFPRPGVFAVEGCRVTAAYRPRGTGGGPKPHQSNLDHLPSEGLLGGQQAQAVLAVAGALLVRVEPVA